jgi:hypothetical protein
MDDQEVRVKAGGLCQCTGECGHTHAWTAEVKKQRCRAPHGCTIVRKRDYPSYWQLTGTDTLPLEYPEHYAVDNPVLVELKPTTVPDGKATKVIAACQRCKLLIEEAAGTGKKRRGKARPKDSAAGG